MKIKSLALVLVLFFSKFSSAESGFRSAQISTQSGNTLTQKGAAQVTAYTAELNLALAEQFDATLRLPLIMGDQNSRHFREVGNPYAGIKVGLLQFGEQKPVSISGTGAVRFARTEGDVAAAAKYDEYHGGAVISKEYSDVRISLEGLYVNKVNESQSGEDVGDEMRGGIGVDIVPAGKLRTHLGYIVRMANQYRYQGEVLSPAGIYNAIEAGAAYRIDTGIWLGVKAQFSSGKKLSAKEIMAFGDSATQLEIQDSVSFGFLAEL